jgi:hypothetical protein
MKNFFRGLLVSAALAIGLASSAHAQGGNTLTFNYTGTPTGTCNYFQIAVDNTTGNVYTCDISQSPTVWKQVNFSGSFPLAVNLGGTGVTTSTGSGSNVLSASPTLTGTVGAAAVTATGIVTAASFATSTANGGLDGTEGTCAGVSVASGHDVLCPASTGTGLKLSNNGDTLSLVARKSDSLSFFTGTSTTSAQFLGLISDEVGSGSKVAKFDSVSGNSGVGSQSSGTLTSGNLVKFDANGNVVDDGIAIASVSGNTTKVATVTGTLTNGDCVKIDASGNLVANGSACGSGGGSGGGAVVYSDAGLTLSGTAYVPFGGGQTSSTTRSDVETLVSAVLISNFRVILDSDPGNTNTVAYTVVQNGSDTTVTCTITGNGTTGISCSDTTHSFTPAANDKIAIKEVTTGVVTGTRSVKIWADLGAPTALAFSGITTGSNTTATMTVGTGGTITTSGSGVNNANQFKGNTSVAVADGGTGRATSTAFGPICAGTTSTGAQQNCDGPGTAAQVLTSNGAGAIPTFQSTKAIVNAWCGNTIGTVSGTAYLLMPAGPTGATSTACTGTSNAGEIPMPYAGTARNMYVTLATACTTGVHVILYKGNVAQTLEVDLTTGTSGSDTNGAHAISFSAGNVWSVRALPQQTTETCKDFRVSFEYDSP